MITVKKCSPSAVDYYQTLQYIIVINVPEYY